MSMRSFWKTAVGFLAAVSACAFTYEGRYEITAQGDFDGDGRQDVVIVDRDTGVFRIGYQLSAGVYTWADPRASGADNASAVAVGKLFQTTRDGLAVGSTLANRINLFDVPSVTGAGIPVSVFPPGIGPNAVVAINIPGSGDTPHDDLIIGSNGNGAPNPTRLAMMRNNAGATSLLLDSTYPLIISANRLVLKKTAPELVGAITRGTPTDSFHVYSPIVGSFNQTILVSGIAQGSRFLYGNFSGALFDHVLFYVPGNSNFVSNPSSEPSPAVYAIGAGVTFDLGKAISQLISSPATSADRLLALFQDGSGAVYNFNGSSAPTLIQTISPDAGERITGAIATPGGDLLTFSGPGNTSTAMRPYKNAGANYTPGVKTTLPGITPFSPDANVYVFAQEPFVSGSPNLLTSMSAGDWTSDLALSGSPLSLTAKSWNFEGTSLGLRNPTAVNFGPVPSGGLFGLVNQYAPSISLFSKSPAVGNEIVDVRISPPPGEFKNAINVSLSSPVAGAQLFIRINPDDTWNLYTGPITLFKTTTVQYYAKTAGDQKSRIHLGVYTFPISPSIQDSDHDGVPDFVELAKGLNPNGGKDSDGDGFSDLNELIAGTDPSNAASFPTDSQRTEEKAAFDLKLGLQPLDGTTSLTTQADLGVGVRAYNLNGSILRAGTTATLSIPTVTDPAVNETNIVLDTDPPLVVVGSDPHFDIATASSDKRLGRELLGFIVSPRTPLPDVVYAYGGGSLATESAGWIAAAQAAYASIPRQQIKDNLDVNDTLIALLFERKVAQILNERGNPAASNLTLFPFRATDTGRTNPPAKLLQSIETRLDDAHPGFKLDGILIGLDNAVHANLPAEMVQLKSLATEIYRISSASNNAAPGKYPSPIDTLRGFFETGIIHSNYAAVLTLTPANVTTALNAYTTALSNVTARPTVNLDLVVRPDTFGGTCTRLDVAGALPAVQKTLIHPGGQQYRLLEAFNLVPGAHIHVFGYSDVQNPICPSDPAVEVISMALDSVPETTADDTDGDLLPDALEYLLFGSLSHSGFEDTDGDGYSNLQELLDGTDPMDSSLHGSLIVNLSPPAVTIETLGTGDIHLSFDYPAAYAGAIHFTIKSTTDLGSIFGNEVLTPINTGGNHFEVTLPNPGATTKFYLLSMTAM